MSNEIDWNVQNVPAIGYDALPNLTQEESDTALRWFFSTFLRHNERFERQVIDDEIIYTIYRDGVEIGRFRTGYPFGKAYLSLATHMIAHERAIEKYGYAAENWPDTFRESANRMMYLYLEALRRLYEKAKLPNPRKFQTVTFSPVVAGLDFVPPRAVAKSGDSDDKQEVTVSTPEETFAWGVLGEAVKFLFGQAGEFLKERREKRKEKTGTQTASPTTPPVSSAAVGSQPITSMDALLEVLKRKTDLAAREMEVKRVDALMREIEKHTDTIDRLREKRAGMLSPTQQVEVEQQIDDRQQQLVQSSKELRTLLERLSGQSIRVEALDE